MWVQISAGLAPVEACRAVYLFLKQVEKECREKNIKLELMDYATGEHKDTLKSVFLKLSGDMAKEYGNSIEGSVLWICKSEFRPNHKRKNWFIEVEVFDEPDTMEFDLNDIKFETMRCSGNGGQHVNKTETGIRLIHLPTGITVKAQEERSQHQNKKLALARLERQLFNLKNKGIKEMDKKRWQEHLVIERGNPVRVFKGREFVEVT